MEHRTHSGGGDVFSINVSLPLGAINCHTNSSEPLASMQLKVTLSPSAALTSTGCSINSSSAKKEIGH